MPSFTRASSRCQAPRRAFGLVLLVLGSSLVAVDASAADEPAKDDDSSLGLGPAMGLDPSAPQAAALPGGMTPAFGQKSASDAEWRFDFHGFLTAPLNMGINKRQATEMGDTGTRPGQSNTVLHSPPLVPDDFETFSHTGVIPTTYVQLNFSDGNSVVAANVSILARQANVSESFLEPASQAGINDAFISITPNLGKKTQLRLLVGAFSSRYGSTGEYDEGRYGTPLIARINGVGELVGTRSALGGDFTLLLEQGFQGQSNKAGASITPDLWNGYADPGEGTTFVNHLHAGLGYRGVATVGAHLLSAWSQDDRSTGALEPDGSIRVLAADLGLSMGRFGHFYGAFVNTKAAHARSVSRIFSVLNSPGGPGLMNNYLGSEADGGDGTGTLTTIGGQYDLSIGRLVSYPVPFDPAGPDLVLSLFGTGVKVSSPLARFDGVTKIKYGAEAGYSLLSWLAVSLRYDRVMPKRTVGPEPPGTVATVNDDRYSFSVLAPRVIFRTDWLATNQIVLQYSHWFDGGLTTVRTGAPPQEDYRVIPDKDVFSLSASMWW
jgi:hypothetical protein